jgi:ubiquinone/menaquinone biosynthesis C-methylase UbiE
MIEKYVANPDYQNYYQKLNGLRRKVARDLPIKPGMHILDVATGSGFFAIEVAGCDSSLKITGFDIAGTDIRNATKNIKKEGLDDRIEILQMDATRMSFPSEKFDMAVNFTGLEDIHMTRGRAGVLKTFHEVSRVLKPDSFFCFVVMPPEEMDTEAQRTEVALFSYICGATWLSAQEYERFLSEAGFILVREERYHTGRKLTPEQARAEIRFAIKNDPKIYGISTRPFEEVWTKFGRQIEKNGLGHYSKVVLMIALNVGEV